MKKSQPDEIFHSYTRAICPDCKKLCDSVRIIRDNRVFIRKYCPDHGRSEALISSDATWFLYSLPHTKRASVPLEHSTSVNSGCPSDCGLCPHHEQHSCLPIIEITNHCNMNCPICLVQNKNNYSMTVSEFKGIIDNVIRKEGQVDTINISGGEPTTHPQLLELLDCAQRPEISRISISTNGLILAKNTELCKELAKRNIYVNLQFDTFDKKILKILRGSGNLADIRRKALKNLENESVRTTIIVTAAKGVNDHAIGDALDLFLASDGILSLMIQPAAYTGLGGSTFAPHDPLSIMTIPDVVESITKQSRGRLKQSDFTPLPCSHPSCFALTYLLKTDSDCVPFPRFIDMDRYLELLSNRGIIQPDEKLEEALRFAIDDLWSGADQIPDSERILATLKTTLRLMYPEEKVLELEERLNIGEAMVKTIFIHAFMDEHTFEIERVKRCCTHYALPDGRIMPACAYNMFYRDSDPRFCGMATDRSAP